MKGGVQWFSGWYVCLVPPWLGVCLHSHLPFAYSPHASCFFWVLRFPRPYQKHALYTDYCL